MSRIKDCLESLKLVEEELKVGTRVKRAKNLDNGMWEVYGDKCLPEDREGEDEEGVYKYGEVVGYCLSYGYQFDWIDVVVLVKWDKEEEIGMYFNHGLQKVK